MTTAAERTEAEISTLADPPLDLLYERSCQLADRVEDGTIGFLDAVDLAWEGALFAGRITASIWLRVSAGRCWLFRPIASRAV